MVAKNRCAFTLIEVLCVVAVVGLIAAILLPAVQMSREAARRAQCLNNLRQILVGVAQHEEARGYLPSKSGSRNESWIVQSLPYLEQSNLYNFLNLDGGDWSIAVEAKLVTSGFSLGWATCPSDPIAPRALMPTNYAGSLGVTYKDQVPWRGLGFAGPVVYSRDEGGTRISDVIDGTSQTAFSAEWRIVDPRDFAHLGHAVPKPLWGVSIANPGSREGKIALCLERAGAPLLIFQGYAFARNSDGFYDHATPPNSPACIIEGGLSDGKSLHPASSWHSGGAHVGFLDGHVAFVRETISPPVWRAIGSISGGEAIAADAY